MAQTGATAATFLHRDHLWSVRQVTEANGNLVEQVGACTAVLKPFHGSIERHVLAAERLHGNDSTVPILAKGKTDTGGF